MKEGSVYNLIDKLDPKDLKYLSSDNIQVDVCNKAKEVSNHAINLASTWKKEGKGTWIHEVLRFRMAQSNTKLYNWVLKSFTRLYL